MTMGNLQQNLIDLQKNGLYMQPYHEFRIDSQLSIK